MKRPIKRRLVPAIEIAVFVTTVIVFYLLLDPFPATVKRELDFDFGPHQKAVQKPKADVTVLPLDDPVTFRNRRLPQERGDKLSRYLHLEQCPIASTDVAAEDFGPPCTNTKELLMSLSTGGRIGVDAPYHARKCAMWWYSTEELCSVLSKFRGIYFVGDTILSDVYGALMVLLREDPMFGAIKQWNYRASENAQCSCDQAFLNLHCGASRISNINQIRDYDPTLIRCQQLFSPEIVMHRLPTAPVNEAELNKIVVSITANSAMDSRPIAVIFGHGHASNFDLFAAVGWVSSVRHAIKEATSPTQSNPQSSPVFELFLTPGATGYQLSGPDILSLGVKAAQTFEMAISAWGKDVGMDILGTWNSTVQVSHSHDGLRTGLKPNMLKAMMTLNWLDLVNPGFSK
ncbi:hypothetical protein V1512DRAFT_257936 [Lipomyces arxii]|uniref:uncharacterized protein n=1 Tax=Lipomyces arxii TaxID=56418 RepID=UPI0034CF4987